MLEGVADKNQSVRWLEKHFCADDNWRFVGLAIPTNLTRIEREYIEPVMPWRMPASVCSGDCEKLSVVRPLRVAGDIPCKLMLEHRLFIAIFDRNFSAFPL